MANKYKVLAASFALALAFATGRYSVRSSTVKQVVTEKETTNVDAKKDMHKKIVIVKQPTGVTTTTITEETATDTKTLTNDQLQAVTTVTPPKVGTLNVSALAGLDAEHSFKPAYGISVTKQVLGPLSVGAFGLTNGVMGVSLGISF
jgi:hypothetical protein